MVSVKNGWRVLQSHRPKGPNVCHGVGVQQSKRHVLQQRGFVDKVNVLDWPADLSPIENVWLIMKRRIRQQQSQTAEHLKSCIKRIGPTILLAEL